MQNPIKISVGAPQINTDSTIPYVSYSVQGQDSKGPFSTRRRYRDFHFLRQKLIQRWPGLYIPPISSKKLAGNTQDKFVQLRKKFLNYFCEKIAQRSYFFNSDIFQVFIRGSGDFEKSARQLQKIDYEALAAIYQKNFAEFTQNASSGQLQYTTQNDYQYMKSAQRTLERVRQDLRALSAAKKDYQKQFNVCMGASLPEFEQKFLLKYVENDKSKLLLNSSNQFSQKLKEYEKYTDDNVLEDYCQMISYDLRELRAFIQAIDSRKRAEQTKSKLQSKRRDAKQQLEKLRAGKTTFKSIFTLGKKQDQIKQLQELIEKSEKQEQSLGNMIFLMNAAICHQISSYKKTRNDNYKANIEKITKKQIMEMSVHGQLLQIPLREQKN